MTGLRHRDLPDRLAVLTEAILGAAIEVNSILKAGMRESHYKDALVIELGLRGFRVEREVPIDLAYKGHPLGGTMRMDLVVEQTVLVEAKSVETLHGAHEAQTISYLAAARLPVGLLINFNAPTLQGQIRRLLPPRLPLLRSSVPDGPEEGRDELKE